MKGGNRFKVDEDLPSNLCTAALMHVSCMCCVLNVRNKKQIKHIRLSLLLYTSFAQLLLYCLVATLLLMLVNDS